MSVMKQIIVTAIAGLLSGCIAGEGNPPGGTAIRVEVLPSSPGKVVSYSLREDDGKLVVSGRVSSLNPMRRPGHVDLIVCNREGRLVDVYRAGLFDYASRRGGVKAGRFTASISPVPAPGSRVALRYDQQAHAAQVQPGCPMDEKPL
jgi:hypothetical protein